MNPISNHQTTLLKQIFSPQKRKIPYIMGILNVTPDSFSDGGQYFTIETAVQKALSMFTAGASIVDIGGESTKPNVDPVTLEEEICRVIPVIHELVKKSSGLISVDTSKPEVAYEAIKSGAHIINDVTGLRDPKMLKVCTESKTPVIISHMQGTPKNMQDNPTYIDVCSEVYEYLTSQAEKAKKAGITEIMIDPGIGFGKTFEHNLAIFKDLPQLLSFSYPVLLGVSRKSFIGKITNVEKADERDAGTIATSIFSAQNGVQLIRVHNVPANIQALKVWQTLN